LRTDEAISARCEWLAGLPHRVLQRRLAPSQREPPQNCAIRYFFPHGESFCIRRAKPFRNMSGRRVFVDAFTSLTSRPIPLASRVCKTTYMSWKSTLSPLPRSGLSPVVTALQLFVWKPVQDPLHASLLIVLGARTHPSRRNLMQGEGPAWRRRMNESAEPKCVSFESRSSGADDV
jgi:hypothetical protein